MNNEHLTPEELSARLDRAEGLPDSRLKHLQGCPSCAQRLEDFRALGKVARATRPPVPTDRMWREISRRIEGGGEKRAPFWGSLLHFPRPLVTGLAGAMLVGLVAVVALRSVDEEATRLEAIPEKAVEKPVQQAAEPPERPKDIAPIVSRHKAGRQSGAGKKAGNAVPAPANAPVAAADMRKSAAPARKAESNVADEAPAASVGRQEEAGRPGFAGKLFTLEAGKIEVAGDGQLRATGGVVVRPVRAGEVFSVIIDGLSRTMTGEVRGISAEIIQPGEKLVVKTR